MPFSDDFGFQINPISNSHLELECMDDPLKLANLTMAVVDGIIGLFAIIQLLRIYFHNPSAKWTRQKVFHVMIFTANFGYAIYFSINPLATCSGWSCWLHVCGFIFLAAPQIIFLATFLLLLSFWVDLCHQANDRVEEEEEEEDTETETEDENPRNPELENKEIISNNLENVWRVDDNWNGLPIVKEEESEEERNMDTSTDIDGEVEKRKLWSEDLERTSLVKRERRLDFMTKKEMMRKKKKTWCFISWNNIHVRGRQKFVIIFVAIVCLFTIVSAILIQVGLQNVSIDSGEMAQIHADFFAVVTLISGGSLAFYGLLLYSKMSRLRSGIHSSDLGKVAWLAVICLVCFSVRAFLVLAENLSVWTGLSLKNSDGTLLPLWYLIYYLVGQAIPSVVVLITLKDMPPKSRESSLSGSTQYFVMVMDDFHESLHRRWEEYSHHHGIPPALTSRSSL